MFDVHACAVIRDEKNIVVEWTDGNYRLPGVRIEEDTGPEELLKDYLNGKIRSKFLIDEVFGTLLDKKNRLFLLYPVHCANDVIQHRLSSPLHLVNISDLQSETLEPLGVLSFLDRNASGELLRLKRLVEESIACCPWVERHLFSQAVLELVSEIEELQEAITSRQQELVASEVGDVLYDAMLALWIHCRDSGTDPSRILRSISDKIAWRKPWLFDEAQISLEEAEQIWQDRKSSE